MPISKGSNPHYPKQGSRIQVSPITNRRVLNRVKKDLTDNPRNFCLFVMGINTALRASDLLKLKVEQVRYLKPGDSLVVKERKTQKSRRITLNHAVYDALQRWISNQEFEDGDWLFPSQRGGKALTVPTLNALVKRWCEVAHMEVGIKQGEQNYGSHTLRKTFGYWQRTDGNVPIHMLMRIFNHSSQSVTLEYLGIQDTEIKDVYMGLEI